MKEVHHRTRHVDREKYSCTLSLTSVLDRDGLSTRRPCRFTPGKDTRYALYSRLGDNQGRAGRLRKISPPPLPPSGIRSPVTSRNFLIVPRGTGSVVGIATA